MSDQSGFLRNNHKPDVLTCIANLSNDEVFTPPELAGQMLDTLAEAWAHNRGGADLWSDKTVRFLDPCTKSGVFLREITRRLTEGLSEQIPDLNERVNHILTRQVFGLAITRLTSLLARRSVYCSKHADGEHSIATGFSDTAGNIWFERTEHSWDKKKCLFCGAPKNLLDRDPERENYAYAFIHTNDIKTRIAELFGADMQFDVIIGNPPYQMRGGGGGSSASSIFHKFVEQAQELEPQYVLMVVPSRWIAGGRGLDEFRQQMLGSGKLRNLVDFPVSKDIFPNVDIKGGVCYFLWDSSYHGNTEVITSRDDERRSSVRKLDEYDIFVRDPHAVKILRKVLKHEEPSITTFLTKVEPFKWASNFTDFQDKPKPNNIPLYYTQKGKRGIGYVNTDQIEKNIELIKTWKILVPTAGSGGGMIPDMVLGKPWVASPPSVCTGSFMFFYTHSETEARSIESYYTTKFFRFLVSLRKITQDAHQSAYKWVPIQTWNRAWDDQTLYRKYQFSKNEIEYIEKIIRPMEISQEGGNE